ncbi:MAG: NAD-dependent deacetylase [Actinobacteria bacterium]|nr:NAD-dependent deacetylase [Actinomycetota bacterium]
MTDIKRVREWLRITDNAVVLSGAGISTDSGIADFRGPNGIWTKDPAAEKAAHIDHYMSDPKVRERAWQNRLNAPFFAAQPNDAHRAVAELQLLGSVSWVVTQNIDGLHQAGGSPPETVLELHGTVWRTRCMNCDDQRPMDETLDRVRADEADPPCLVCGGILKSATISFGQSLDPDVLDRAAQVCGNTPLLIVIGSTLGVYPAAGLVPLAVRGGATLVIVNDMATDYDELADVLVREPIGDVVPAFMPNYQSP